VDRDPKLVRSLRASRERLGASQVTVEQADAIAYMRRAPAAAFDIVFLDPPFAQGLSEPALAAAGRLVVPGGFIYLEAEEALDEVIPASPALVLQRRGRAGAVRFHLLQRSRADESC
jgi:16S rRNA G966 N2-methylase RsmD